MAAPQPPIAIEAVERDAFPLLWPILEPVIREGATYPLPLDLGGDAAADYWFAPGNRVYGARAGERVLGTYYLKANNRGGGAHVANAGFMTAPEARGRGVARAMCRHALAEAKRLGFRAMQFNFVISTNTRAVALWQGLGFAIIGTLPGAFRLPDGSFADAHVMYRGLS